MFIFHASFKNKGIQQNKDILHFSDCDICNCFWQKGKSENETFPIETDYELHMLLEGILPGMEDWHPPVPVSRL